MTFYETTDLGEAAFLIATGHPVRDLKQPGPGPRMIYCFDTDARPKAEEYYKGGLVPARPYAAAMRDLKQMFARINHRQYPK